MWRFAMLMTFGGMAALGGVTAALAGDETPAWQEPSSVVTRGERTEDGWLVTFIRGEAAKAIFDGLDAALEVEVARPGGSSAFRHRGAAAIGCSYSNLFAGRERYLCAFATAVDGATAPVQADPEMGGVARIGVSN